MENIEKEFNEFYISFIIGKFLKQPIETQLLALKNMCRLSQRVEFNSKMKSDLEFMINSSIRTLWVNLGTDYGEVIPWEKLSEEDKEFCGVLTKEEYENSRPMRSTNDRLAFHDLMTKYGVGWFFSNKFVTDEYLIKWFNEFSIDNN